MAVHDEGFQLDGDLTSACPAALPLCTPDQKDWAQLFTVSDTATTETVANNTSIIGAADSPFTHGTFVRDFETGATTATCAIDSLSTKFCTGDDTTFATGSKDTLDISGWQCNHDNNVNSKIDIMNAYAVAYTIPAGQPFAGDRVMYFGLEKNKDNGVNDVGFWFLQGNANCSAPSGHQDWTGGLHTVGDVLVVSEFSNGGGVSNITAYRWVGGSNPLVQIGTAGDCKGSNGGDTMCATTNSGTVQFNTKVQTPWLTSDATLGVGRNQIVPPDFFEGGINLTKAFEDTGGGEAPSCFNTFIADTRSSKETGATLFDYARGELGQCAASITTQATTNSTTVVPGTIVYDTATITGTAPGTPPVPSSDENTGGSNVSFYICEQLAAGDCTSTNTPVGSSKELTPTGQPGQASATSDGYDTTGKAEGRYCFYAVWPGDSNYTTGASGGAAATECFTIAKIPTTTVTTPGTLSADTPPVFTPVTTITLGGSVVDRAVVSGNAAGGDPTGDVNFFVCAIASGTCSTGGTAVTGNPVSLVSDGNPATYTSIAYSGAFTPTAIGRYCFRAEYGGSAIYNTSGDSAATECFTVTTTSSAATFQRWLPNDRIVVTSQGQNLAGTLTVQLRSGTCTGTVVYTDANAVSFTATTTGAVYQTSNTSVYVGTNPDGSAGLAAGTYFWSVTFAPTSTFATGFTKCETSTLSINNNP